MHFATGLVFEAMNRQPMSLPSRNHRGGQPLLTRPESYASARAAGVRYIQDTIPGIRRLRSGKGFRYIDSGGRTIHDPKTLGRIRALAIPPAWIDVWICPLANGHLQAVGRDARGRKQYRYHPRWREFRDRTKYHCLLAFGQALPRIRAAISKDLACQGLPRHKVLATLVRLLELTHVRIGGEEYVRQNGSYGLTTLRDRHAKIRNGKILFRFRGKCGILHNLVLDDRRLARIVQRCQEVPGQDLFQYFDDTGKGRRVTSTDVNDYLREISGQNFTAKDFRTWSGTVHAFMALKKLKPFRSKAQAKQNLVRALESVARELGNTPAVCRKCYVHPAVLEAYLDGDLTPAPKYASQRVPRSLSRYLAPEEAALYSFLQQRSPGS
jgi:DNA topoisomerase-1